MTVNNIRCHFCGSLPTPRPVSVPAGFYIECSECDETGPVQPSPETAWLGWTEGPYNPRRGAE